MREIRIEPAQTGQRLDKFLLKYMNKASKAFIYKMLRKKNITYNNARAQGSEILQAGDVLSLYLSDETIEKFMKARILRKPGRAVSIQYEDENILICQKPAGLLSQPEKAGDDDTLIDRVLEYLHDKGEFSTARESTFTPALCNRLDRNTSGLVLCGKNLQALQQLNRIIAENKVDKYYLAIVKGEVQESGVLHGYHEKDEKSNKAVVVSEGSKEMITEYKPLKAAEGYSLLEIKLVTGKSHQIRVHMNHMGHPVMGDGKYGDKQANALFRERFGLSWQLLHAYKLIFREDSGHMGYLCGREFIMPPPLDFAKISGEILNYAIKIPINK